MDLFTKSDAPSYYDEGMKAFSDGKDFWECPHVTAVSLREALNPWLAGWMMAKQLKSLTNKTNE